jgi:hypothetical protein
MIYLLQLSGQMSIRSSIPAVSTTGPSDPDNKIKRNGRKGKKKKKKEKKKEEREPAGERARMEARAPTDWRWIDRSIDRPNAELSGRGPETLIPRREKPRHRFFRPRGHAIN